MSVFAGLCGMFKASLTAYSLSPARSRVSMSSQSWLDKMEVLSTHPYWLNKMVLCDDTCAPSSARNNCAVVQASGADAQVYHYWLTNAAVIGRVRSDMLAFCFIYKSSPSYIIDQIQLALCTLLTIAFIYGLNMAFIVIICACYPIVMKVWSTEEDFCPSSSSRQRLLLFCASANKVIRASVKSFVDCSPLQKTGPVRVLTHWGSSSCPISGKGE